jgi:hypothetical protein
MLAAASAAHQRSTLSHQAAGLLPERQALLPLLPLPLAGWLAVQGLGKSSRAQQARATAGNGLLRIPCSTAGLQEACRRLLLCWGLQALLCRDLCFQVPVPQAQAQARVHGEMARMTLITCSIFWRACLLLAGSRSAPAAQRRV